jgi:hypothetical protein
MFIKDFPKLQSPFVRIDNVNKQHVVIPQLENGYEWIFDKGTICTEKLDGSDVSVIIERGKLTRIFNRENEIDFFSKGKDFIVDGIRHAHQNGKCNFTDGQYFGELIGEKLQKNPYQIKGHTWVPFDPYCKEALRYHCWDNILGTVDVKSKESVCAAFDIISEWFQYGLNSIYLRQKGITQFAEGVVFYSPEGRMAKLRRDMFDWFKGRSHKE